MSGIAGNGEAIICEDNNGLALGTGLTCREQGRDS
jgi:hypothetical protein